MSLLEGRQEGVALVGFDPHRRRRTFNWRIFSTCDLPPHVEREVRLDLRTDDVYGAPLPDAAHAPDEARALVADVAARTRLMVHENWRFRPYYRQISDWLRSARIGRVVQAQMTVLSSGLIPDADGKLPVIVRQPFIATLDRALVMEVLIHQIDTLRFLLGDMQVAHSQLGKTCRATVGEDRAFVTFVVKTSGGCYD